MLMAQQQRLALMQPSISTLTNLVSCLSNEVFDWLEDNKDLLQHPRRHLGNRYRSQAKKFVKLATMDENRFVEKHWLGRAKCRQAILYDFTDEDNGGVCRYQG